MPRPYRRTVARRSSPEAKARAGKNDAYIRGLYHRLGPVQFWTRRLNWLVHNGKWVSYIRLVAYLRRNGIECGEIADLSIQSQLDPVGYRQAVRRLKVSPGASKPASHGRFKTSQDSWGFSSTT
jgi:hypothetical protein